jgi:hypothetical protein
MLGLTGCRLGGGFDSGDTSPVAAAVTGNVVTGKVTLPATATDTMVANVIADANPGVRAAVTMAGMKVRLHTTSNTTAIQEADVDATAGTFSFANVPNGTMYRLSLVTKDKKNIILQYFVDALANNAGLKDFTINASSTAVALVVEKSGFTRKASEFYQNGVVISSLTSIITDVESWLGGLATGSADVNTALFSIAGFNTKVTQVLADMPTTTTSTNTTTGGDVVLEGIISDSDGVGGSIRAAIRGAIVANATVTASVFDGKTETFLATGTTDATGTYKLEKLPRGLKNLIIRAIKGTQKYGVIVPALPEVTDASAKAMAPVITRTTINQVTIIEVVAKTDVAIRDVNLADMMSLVSPESMGKLSADELQKLGTNLADREKARQATKTQFGVDETLFRAFNSYSQKLAQEIQEGIARGDPQYTSDAWEKLYPQKLQAKARELGLPADALMAMQNIDKNMFGVQVQQTLSTNTNVKDQLDKNLAVKKYSDLFSSLMQAIKDLETVSFAEVSGLERSFFQIIDDLQRVKPVDMAGYLSNHPSAMMIPALMKKALEPLGLLTGTTLVGLLPKDTDFSSLSWDPTKKTAPTTDQVVAYEKKMREVMFANIRANAPLLAKLVSDKKIGALLFLLIGPRELGFDPKSLVSGAVAAGGSAAVMSSQVMGIVQAVSPAKVINGQTYGFSIKPPTDFPAGPKEWNGLLGYLRADTGVTLAVSASENVSESFIVTVDMEAAPLAAQAPAFKAKVVAKNTVAPTVTFTTATKFQGMLFLKNNEYFLGAPNDSAVANPFAKVTFKDDTMKGQAAIMVNRMVQGEATVAPSTTATGIPTFTVTFIALSTTSIAPTTPPPGGGTATPTMVLSLVKGLLVKSGTEFTIASGTLNEFNQWKAITDKLVVKWAANANASPTLDAAANKAVLLAGEIKLENNVKVLHVQNLQFDTVIGVVTTNPTFPIPAGAGMPNGVTFFLGRVINETPTGSPTWKLTDSFRIENNQWVKMTHGMTLIDTTNMIQNFRDKMAVVAGSWKDATNMIFTVTAVNDPNVAGGGTATATATITPLASQTIFGIWYVKQDSPRKPVAPNYFDRLDITNGAIRRTNLPGGTDFGSYATATGLEFFGTGQAKQRAGGVTQITWEVHNGYLQEWAGEVGSGGNPIVLTKNATTIHGGPVTKEADGSFVINKGGAAQATLVSKTIDLNTLVNKTIEISEAQWVTQPTTTPGIMDVLRATAQN